MDSSVHVGKPAEEPVEDLEALQELEDALTDEFRPCYQVA